MTMLVQRLICRMTLLLMLATFLSPGLGWQMAVVHEHDDHAGHHILVGGHDHDTPHEAMSFHVEADAAQPDTHLDAHSMMGHLLGHMPANLVHIQPLVVRAGGMVLNAPPSDGMSQAIPDRLYRPPLNLPV